MEYCAPWQSLLQNEETNIEIIIHSIENIIRTEDISIWITVEHSGTTLGESQPIFIKSNCEELTVHAIDLNVNLRLFQKDKKNLESIVSIPVLIKATEGLEDEHKMRSATSSSEVKKRSIFSTKSASLPASKLLGICNLDLMPLLMGDKSFTEKLILETPSFSMDSTMVSWHNLPRLAITASQEFVPISSSSERINILNITVESIYNLPKSFTENVQYRAGTIAFTDNEVVKNIIFDQGAWTRYRDVDRTKRWNTLRHVENRAQLSKYKLDCDFMGVRNEFKKQLDLAKICCEDIPRVEWNSMNRCVLWDKGIEAMQNHIQKYKYWPFQFEMTIRGSPGKSKGSASVMTQTYQCYVDVSELLFPGRKSCRIVAQLYQYNPTDMSEKLGLEQNIFGLEPQSKELKEKDKKSKTSKNTQSVQSEGEAAPSAAVVTENGEPTIVIVEIELYKPLIASRIEMDLANLITQIIPQAEKKQPYVHSSDVAEAQYVCCIQKLAEVLTECYRDFCDENKEENRREEKQRQKKYCFDPESDELTCFTQYLYKTGVYLTVRNTLRLKIPMLIDQKFEMPTNLVDSNESHNFIASIYTYLVEQMHIAINRMVEGRPTKDFQTEVDAKMMNFYAEEAYELGDLAKAKQYYTTVIMSSKNDVSAWTEYALFLKKIGDKERARECCLEAIRLDRRYAIALLTYAIILFENKEYREAEIFLRAITDLHPRFFEAWAILHLFYIRTDYYPGVDLTLRVAEKCMQDKSHTITLDQEPLSWTTYHCPQDNVYMMVATFLLKLNFCEFAGLAIAEEMSNSNRSIHVLYYMAVEHYLSGKYEDALSHLEEIRCNHGMDYSISSLMGHCYFKMGNTEKEIECYEFARMLFDRPEDLHLVEIRLGHHYYNTGDFDRARRIFLSACRTSPTSITWLGVGMSCYELKQFHDAEMSLTEANRIDNQNPEIWAYLCLLNMTLQRYDEFAQCYAEMVKNNLKNRKLWLRITNLMEAMNYAPPNLTEAKDLTEHHSTEGSEEQFEN